MISAELFIIKFFRKGFYIASRIFSPSAPPLPWVQDYKINKPFPINVRLYHPDPQKPLPLMVYAHGGGWVCGSLETYSRFCQFMAKKLNIAILSVDYRLAPEFPYPAALEDLEKTYKWVEKNSEILKIDSKKVIVGGDSAGGNLMAGLINRLMNKESSSLPKAVLLLCPALDLSLSSKSIEAFTISWILWISRLFMDFFKRVYLPKGLDPKHPSVSPFYQEDLKRFPPTLLVSAGWDILASESLEFEKKLKKQGRTVYHKRLPAVPHVFMVFARLFPKKTDKCMKWISECLKKTLA